MGFTPREGSTPSSGTNFPPYLLTFETDDVPVATMLPCAALGSSRRIPLSIADGLRSSASRAEAGRRRQTWLPAIVEKRAHIVDPQRRLLERREVTTMGHVRPAHDVIPCLRAAA